MFGRKAKEIKNLKENIKEINRQKIEANNDLRMLQHCFNDYTRTCDTFMSTIKELMSKSEEKEKPKKVKKETKKNAK